MLGAPDHEVGPVIIAGQPVAQEAGPRRSRLPSSNRGCIEPAKGPRFDPAPSRILRPARDPPGQGGRRVADSIRDRVDRPSFPSSQINHHTTERLICPGLMPFFLACRLPIVGVATVFRRPAVADAGSRKPVRPAGVPGSEQPSIPERRVPGPDPADDLVLADEDHGSARERPSPNHSRGRSRR